MQTDYAKTKLSQVTFKVEQNLHYAEGGVDYLHSYGCLKSTVIQLIHKFRNPALVKDSTFSCTCS